MCKIITLSQLKAAGACANALQRFAAAFGESVQVTPALAGKYADQFDWKWAADNLLSIPAWTEYEAARVAAWAKYETARVKYETAVLVVLNSPPSARDGVVQCPHGPSHMSRRAINAAQIKRNKAIARAWATLYIKEGI